MARCAGARVCSRAKLCLVHGAAGGVGLTAVEIGKAMGATVIATAGEDEKLKVAAEHGADHLINYRTQSIRDRVKEICKGGGADVVYDPVGGSAFDASLRSVNWGARLVLVGFASGQVPRVPGNILLVKNISAIGFYLGLLPQPPAGTAGSGIQGAVPMVARRQAAAPCVATTAAGQRTGGAAVAAPPALHRQSRADSRVMSDSVREQYELYPYPRREPRDEAKRLIVGSPGHLREIDHWVFGARRPASRPLHALIAGGGTGDATIMLAQQMAREGRAGSVTWLDRSAASLKVAQARAAVRGLANIVWEQRSLLELPGSGLGPFDYIDCCGVLHHLPDPAEGVRALLSVLAPGGGLGLMVYAPHGRTGVYHAAGRAAASGTAADAPAAGWMWRSG